MSDQDFQLLDMGYTQEDIEKAMRACEKGDPLEVLIDFIEAQRYNDMDKEDGHSPKVEESCETCTVATKEDLIQKMCEMGFDEDQISRAIEFCGEASPIHVLADFIYAHFGNNNGSKLPESSSGISDVETKSWKADTKEGLKHKLCDMGYEESHVCHAIEFCGLETSIEVLTDFIYAKYGCSKDSKEIDDSNHSVEDASSNGDLPDEQGGVEMRHPDNTCCNSKEGYGNLESQFDDIISSNEECNDELSSPFMHRLRTMGFSSSSIQEAANICGLDDLNTLLDFLMNIESSESSADELDTSWLDEAPCSSSMHIEKKSKRVKRRHKLDDIRSGTSILREKVDEFVFSRSTSRIATRRPLSFNIRDMKGFSLPKSPVARSRTLDPIMQGPPFFYFENVALMPNSEWDTIKRFFNGVDPEFVDSANFSACHRRRGYVHNLPIHGREEVCPKPAMTLQEAFPNKTKYWPAWDSRTKMNCINTVRSPHTVCNEIAATMSRYRNDVPPHEQKVLLTKCRKFNLIWVNPGHVAPLDPLEMEILLGFEEGHTRGTSSTTERYMALGNSFQVDTVSYHLSVLRSLYPDGIKVLSLFSGIGGAEVALHKAGIRLKVVVSVERNPKRQDVLKSWWTKTGQTGELIHKDDVLELTHEVMYSLVKQVGRFDLVVGGSPCNNLTGSNRVSRVGLGGEHSCLFFEFPRIFYLLKELQ